MSVLSNILRFIGDPLNSIYGPQNYLATVAPITLGLVTAVSDPDNRQRITSNGENRTSEQMREVEVLDLPAITTRR